MAGRRQRETEGLIGFRQHAGDADRPSGDPSFRTLLARVREVTLGAYAHQDLPFEKLVAELTPSRDRSRQSLFQVTFNLQNQPVPSFDWADLRLTPLAYDHTCCKFDLAVVLFETPAKGFSGRVDYATDLFDAGTIEQFVRAFEALLTRVVADPDLRIHDIDVPIDTAHHPRSSVPPLRRRPATDADRVPLSLTQEWIRQRAEADPDGAADHHAIGVALSGELHRVALDRSLAEIVARHAPLGGRAILPDADLRGLDDRAQDDALAGLIAETTSLRFDLRHEPPLRTRLVRLDDTRHLLLLVVHQIAADRRSSRIVAREIDQLYHAFRADHPSPLPAPPLEFADVAVWERGWLCGDELDRRVGTGVRTCAASPRSRFPPTMPGRRRRAGARSACRS